MSIQSINKAIHRLLDSSKYQFTFMNLYINADRGSLRFRDDRDRRSRVSAPAEPSATAAIRHGRTAGPHSGQARLRRRAGSPLIDNYLFGYPRPAPRSIKARVAQRSVILDMMPMMSVCAYGEKLTAARSIQRQLPLLGVCFRTIGGAKRHIAWPEGSGHH